MVHVVAAAIGLSAVLMRSAVAYSALKYVGAAYLIYLGARMIARRRFELSEVPTRPGRFRDAFVQGIVTESLNPKTAIFFLTFLPQFVTPGESMTPQLVLLGTICVVLNSVADLVVIAFATPLSFALRRRPHLRAGQQVFCGGTLMGLGCLLAFSGRRE